MHAYTLRCSVYWYATVGGWWRRCDRALVEDRGVLERRLAEEDMVMDQQRRLIGVESRVVYCVLAEV
ncbi:hypothetical protein L209DRAFT_758141 [Thermothelomyces heterothallicus CBS 203.75]